jgi:serine/threonine protein kinase
VGAANNISPHQNRSKSTGSTNPNNTAAQGKGGIGGGGKQPSHQQQSQQQQPPAAASFHTKYDLSDVIGVGSTSTVHRCLERSTQKEYACKIIDKRMIETRFRGLLDQFQIEIGVLKALHHPNIIHLEDVYETDTRIYMVMELMRGEFVCMWVCVGVCVFRRGLVGGKRRRRVVFLFLVFFHFSLFFYTH